MAGIKISVIIPVYNASKYLRQCLDSILNQTLKEIEIICVDDGSTDDSLKILEEYQKKDNRISIFTQKNSGAAVARNKGLDIAKGDYIAFMDPDDYYPDGDVLFSIYEKVCDNNALIAGGSLALDRNESDYKPKYETKDERFFDNDGFIKFYDYQYDFYYQRFIYKKELIDKNNIIFPLYRRGQDIPFFVKAMIAANEFYAMERKTYCYRVEHKKINWENSMVSLHTIQATSDIVKIAKKNNLETLLARAISRLLRYSNEILKFNNDLDILEVIHNNIKNLEINNNEKINSEKECLVMKLKFLIKLKKAKQEQKVEIISGKIQPAKVSVIIPVYNVEKYLEECLDSICGQTLKEISIICVNDGSTDGSLNILKKYANVDSRILLLSQENGGLSAARNTGIQFTKSEYIYFCDSDDKLELTALEELYNKSEADNLDMLYFDAKAFFENAEVENKFSSYKTYYKRKYTYEGVFIGKELFSQFLKNGDYLAAACLNFIQREFLLNNKLFFEPGILHEDNLWSFKCALTAGRVGYLPKVFFYRRVRANSIVTQEISFAHVYGYFISAIKGIEFLKNVTLSDDEHAHISNLIADWINNAKRLYVKLNNYDKDIYKILDSYEKFMFNYLIIDKKTNKLNVCSFIFKKINKIAAYYKKHGLKNTLLRIKFELTK